MKRRASTKDIVKSVASIVKSKFYTDYSDFESWYGNIMLHEEDLVNHLEDNIKEFFPLRKEVWKLIVKEVYGVMPFSKEYILKNYRHVYQDIPYLVYPASNPKKIIILFTGYINYESYNRFSWFFDETEKWDSDTLYLFLGDQDLSWYVGLQENPKMHHYKHIIESLIDKNNVYRENVYMVGASMGGYAAILFGTLCSVGGVISVHPQLMAKSANRYHLNNWKRQISKCGNNFIELDDLIAQNNMIPTLYLEVGRNAADEYGLDGFIQEMNKKDSFYMIKRHSAINHETTSPSREKLESLISFFELKSC